MGEAGKRSGEGSRVQTTPRNPQASDSGGGASGPSTATWTEPQPPFPPTAGPQTCPPALLTIRCVRTTRVRRIAMRRRTMPCCRREAGVTHNGRARLPVGASGLTHFGCGMGGMPEGCGRLTHGRAVSLLPAIHRAWVCLCDSRAHIGACRLCWMPADKGPGISARASMTVYRVVSDGGLSLSASPGAPRQD